jgi:hypothetical protein
VSFLLKKPFFETVSPRELAEQITSKKKCKKKLPKWFETPLIYYPKKINIEQTSSEATARYKSEIVSGKTLVDLTGGFGVDSYFFSHKIDTVFHCEIDVDLAEISAHNFKILGVKNVKTIPSDGLQFLKISTGPFDWIFIDPSRRDTLKGKVFHLSDCIPDVGKYFELFFDKTQNVLLKTSPFLDITAALKDLQNVMSLHIVAVNNEVKELLWVLKKGYLGAIDVKTMNLGTTDRQTFGFLLREENEAHSSFSLPQTYLYEPNAAIMKSGAFKIVGQRYSTNKIHRNTHLYTSDTLLNFPGRRFLIKESIPYDKKASSFLKGLKANVATRNFPQTVNEIRKKHGILDGGNAYLFFVTDMNEKCMILNCLKVM